MLTKKDREAIKQVEFACMDDLVPPEHLLRAVEDSLDFSFIYDEVKDLYSENHGRPSIDPVVLIKLLMLQALFGIRSMRQTVKEAEVNLAYRWFLGYGFQEPIPHFSTFGKNYVRRFAESTLFETIFERVLVEAITLGFVRNDVVFIDATHIKASANKNKHIKAMVKHRVHKYKRELMAEINEDRIAHGKKPLEDDVDADMDTDNGMPKEITDTASSSDTESNKPKMVTVSTTDPECGLFHKGDKERCFAYTVTTVCDRNNFILGLKAEPGNVHDSQVFSAVFEQIVDRYPAIEAAVVDAGYKYPGICREIIKAGIEPIMPYRRPMTPEGYFKKHEYVYDEYYDCYLCPNNEVLEYRTTNRNGYREYKSNPKVCVNCSMRQQCTHSKNHTKVVTRHIWEEYMEIAEDIRHTKYGKELYRLRSETIERVFADAKEKHGMRYTHLRGLRKVQHYLTLLFACMNLKKLAMWKTKYSITQPPAAPTSLNIAIAA